MLASPSVFARPNFATMFFDNIPADFKKEMYAWLDVNSAADRKPGMTDEQFYYKTRKNAIGPVLLGPAKPVHVLRASTTVRRIVNMTALTVADANAQR